MTVNCLAKAVLTAEMLTFVGTVNIGMVKRFCYKYIKLKKFCSGKGYRPDFKNYRTMCIISFNKSFTKRFVKLVEIVELFNYVIASTT